MPKKCREIIAADLLSSLERRHTSLAVPGSFSRQVCRKTSTISVRVDAALARDLKESFDLSNSLFPADLISKEDFVEVIMKIGLKAYGVRLEDARSRLLLSAEQLLDLEETEPGEAGESMNESPPCDEANESVL